MDKGIRRMAVVSVIAFILILLNLVWIQGIKRWEIITNPYNKRLVAIENKVQRGQILDRNGLALDGEATAHILGYNSIKHGKAGVEAIANQRLLGLNETSLLFGGQGKDVLLTLDNSLQQGAYRALQGYKGSILVLDGQTSEILVAATSPSYDRSKIDQEWQRLISDEQNAPLINRPFQGQYPPGSVFKLVTTVAGLRSGIDLEWQCDGELQVGPWELREKAHGSVDKTKALAVSCNTYFAKMATEVGWERFQQTVTELGFGEKVGIELPEEPGYLGVSKDKDLLAQTGIGQGKLLVTPLQVAQLIQAISNDGMRVRPTLMLKDSAKERWLTPAEVRVLQEGMSAVVQSGTGTKAQQAKIQVLGKTGTAENPHGAPHAWFAGYARQGEQTRVVVVMLENGGHGGDEAALLAGRLLNSAFEVKR